MKKIAVLVIGLLSLLAVTGVAIAGKDQFKRVDSSVSINFKSGSGPYGQGASFSGEVEAKKKCKKQRVVKIRSKNDGAIVGRDTTNGKTGKYLTGVRGNFVEGERYFASVKSRDYIVKKKNRNVRIICKKTKSKPITAG